MPMRTGALTTHTLETHAPGMSGFYDRLPVFDRFSRLPHPSIYTPVPADWVLGLAAIVHSTAALAAGRYKEVNTAAAAVIAAIANALHGNDFPFIFGGDGANFALPSDKAYLAREALTAVAAWVRHD